MQLCTSDFIVLLSRAEPSWGLWHWLLSVSACAGLASASEQPASDPASHPSLPPCSHRRAQLYNQVSQRCAARLPPSLSHTLCDCLFLFLSLSRLLVPSRIARSLVLRRDRGSDRTRPDGAGSGVGAGAGAAAAAGRGAGCTNSRRRSGAQVEDINDIRPNQTPPASYETHIEK